MPTSLGQFIHRHSLVFAPILKARRNHPTPHSPSIAVRLKFTRLMKVHFRYGLYACGHPRSGSGATFIRRCFRVSVTIHTYAIATQSTNLLLWQDSHLLGTDRLSQRIFRFVAIRTAQNGISSSKSRLKLELSP